METHTPSSVLGPASQRSRPCTAASPARRTQTPSTIGLFERKTRCATCVAATTRTGPSGLLLNTHTRDFQIRPFWRVSILAWRPLAGPGDGTTPRCFAFALFKVSTCQHHAPNDVRVLQLKQDRDFANRRRRHAVIQVADLLQRHDVARGEVHALVYNTIAATTNRLALHVVGERRRRHGCHCPDGSKTRASKPMLSGGDAGGLAGWRSAGREPTHVGGGVFVAPLVPLAALTPWQP